MTSEITKITRTYKEIYEHTKDFQNEKHAIKGKVVENGVGARKMKRKDYLKIQNKNTMTGKEDGF